MATISNATTGNDILVPTNDNVTYRGLSGDDVYILSSAIAANAKVSIVDTSGANRIQLVDGLSITSSRFAADAVELTLSNGAVVTVNGADNFTFEVGGNDTSGTAGTDQTYAQFASAMGVASLPSGTTLVAGTANVSVSGANIGSGVGSGSVTILTAGYDDLTGGAGNDTYIGVIGTGTTLTADSFDVIDGGAGVDTVSLNLSDGDFSGDTTITNVEIMSFRASTGDRTATSLLQQEGVTQITNDRSTKDLTVAGIPNVVDLKVDRVLNGEHTEIIYDVVPTIGTATAQNLTLTGSGATSNITISASGTDGVENLFVTSTGSILGQSALTVAVEDVANASTLKEFHLAGESKLTVVNALNFAGTAVGATVTGTINLADSTGGSALTVGADAENISYTGGSGNDKITFAATFTAYDAVDGGDGTDTIALSGITSFNPVTLGSITNTEIIQIEASNNNNITASNFDKTTATALHWVENDTTGKNLTVSTLKAGDTVGIIQNNNGAVGTATLGLKDASGTADELNLELYGKDGDTKARNTVADVSFTSVETLNITSDVVTTLGNERLVTASSEANVITDISADTSLTTINVSGNDNLDLTIGGESTKLSTFDASGYTGDMGLTNNAASATTYKLGSGNDTIAFGTTLNGSDTVTDAGNRTATTADRITATIAGLSSVTGTGALKTTDVEYIDLTAGTSASSIDAAGIVGATHINIGSTDATAVTLTNIAEGVVIGVGNNAATGTDIYKGTLTASLADETGTDDSLTFLLGDTGADDDVDATLVTNAALESVTIQASSDLGEAGTNEADLNVSKVKATTLTIKGGNASTKDEGLDLTGTGAATLHLNTATVDASAHLGALTVKFNLSTGTTFTARGDVIQTVTGSNKNDTIDLTAAAGTVAHVIDGGTGTDTLKLSVGDGANTDVTGITNVEIIDVTVAASASVDLTQDNAGSFMNDTESSTLYIRGGNSLSTFNLADDPIDGTEVLLIDASDFNGRINSIAFDADAMASTTQIIGGASTKDTIKYGTDTDATTTTPYTSGVEYHVYSHNTGDTAGAESTTIALTKADGITNLYLESAVTTHAQTITLSDYDSAKHGTVYIGETRGSTPFDQSAGASLTVNHASSTGTDDTLNLFLVDTGDADGSFTLTAAGTENLNITVGADAEAFAITTSAVAPTLGSKTTITISGYLATASAAATLSLNTTGTGTTTINAGAFAGTFNLTDRAAVDMTITGSLGADTIQMEKTGDVISGGTGSDTLDVKYDALISGITIDLSNADDQIVSMDGAATGGTVTGFEKVDLTDFTGGFGANITSGSSTVGAYSIEGTLVTDAIYFGLGTDTYVYNDEATNVDTIYNFTAGTDTITLDISDLETASAIKSGRTAVLVMGDDGADAAAGTLNVTEVSDNTNTAIGANSAVVVLVGATFAAVGDVKGALETGGSRDVTVSDVATDVDDAMFVVYSDGTDAYVAAFIAVAETASNDGIYTGNDLQVVNLIKLSGITSIASGDFTSAMFDFQA